MPRERGFALSALQSAGALLALALSALLATGAQAQPVTLDQLTDAETAVELDAADRQKLEQSLDDVITTLEDAEQRGALLEDLRELRAAIGETEEEPAATPGAGLLDALSAALDEFADEATPEGTLLDAWAERTSDAWQDISAIATDADTGNLAGFATDIGVFVAVWVALVGAGLVLARRVSNARGWPQRLPNEPRGWLLAAHLLRRLIPWALGFGILLGSLQLVPATPGRTTAVVLAYAALLGRSVGLVCELVLAVFARGHRRPAVAILRRHGLPRLFLLGALVGLADATGSGTIESLLGTSLAELVALLISGVATLLAGDFVLRFRRPIRHAIYNRPFHERRRNTTANELLRLISRYWHLPVLVLVLMSLVTVVVATGEPGEVLARGVICIALLTATLVATGLINHHAERLERRPRRISDYQRRLERFGYTVAHLVAWTAFIELSLWVWGGSLFGFGQETLGGRIAQALLAVAITALLAWLAWIVADSTIQRGLTSTMEGRGRRVNTARVQTITPMVRNVIFTAILVIAVIVALANLGVNVTPLLAGAGIIGIAIGFGAQTLVQDLITGMFILIEDSLAIDDFVDLGGQMGTVECLSLRTVRLRDLDGILHIVPFSQIQAIHNMSRQFGVALIRVKVPHTSAIDDVRAILQEVSEDVRNDPEFGRNIWAPLEFQGVERFEDGAAVLRVRVRTAPVMQWEIAREFNLRLKRRFEEDGLDLATQRISLRMEGRAGASPADGDDPGEDTPQDNAPTPER